MADEKEPEMEEDLSTLLDSALADFSKPKNTDDELDSLMAKMDAEAMEKAAQNFDKSIQKKKQNFAAYSDTANLDKVNPLNYCWFLFILLISKYK